jgi:hypothetical protein
VGTWGVAVPLPATACSSSTGDDDISWRQDTGIRNSSTGLKVPNNLDFKRNFDVCQPVLGLQDDDADIVYFTTMIHGTDDKAWVAAMDMSKELLGVTTFPDPRASTLLSRTAGYPII